VRFGALAKVLSAAEAEIARLHGHGRLVSESTQLNTAQRAVDAAHGRRERARVAYEHRRAIAAHEARAAEDARRLAVRTRLALDASAEAQRHVVDFSKERSAAVRAELGDARRKRDEERAMTRAAQDKAATTERLAMRAMAASKARADALAHSSTMLCDAWQSEHDACVARRTAAPARGGDDAAAAPLCARDEAHPLPPCRPLHPPPPHRSYKRNNALFGDAPPDALVHTFAQQRAAGTNARRHQAPPIPPAAKKRGARALELFKAQTGAEGWRGMRSKA
jgi:hypothetical protein